MTGVKMVLGASLALSMAVCASGLKVDISASDESRRWYAVEQFGLVQGGKVDIEVKDFSFSSKVKGARAAFLLHLADSENMVLDAFHEEIREEYSTDAIRECPIDKQRELQLIGIIEFKGEEPLPLSKVISHEVDLATEGIYDLSFVRCGPDVGASYTLHTEMYNAGPNYLTAGEMPTPTILFLYGLVFLGMLVAWITYLKRKKLSVHKVHHMMTVILLLKTLTVFAEAFDMHYVKVYGSSVTWNFLYHLLRALRTIMFFVVIIMIGTGWSLLKPALSPRERKFLMAAFSLQVVANIALVVADELTRGSSAMMKWENAFQLVDLVCCLAVTFPIYSHIQFLESQSQIDGKGQVNLAKLRQFRRFYLLVFAYIYFTRIIVFLAGNAMNFRHLYVAHILRETASVLFYGVIGYLFRPVEGSAYLKLPAEDGEYGLEDDDDYVPSRRVANDDVEDPLDEDHFFNEDEHREEFGLEMQETSASARGGQKSPAKSNSDQMQTI
ncbi:Protein GPR108 [Hondaea fermentalgiana]|uniref:Protein GPR108 n=1 Tax=Hondaea fermentalgiana TaxID=2315210 RepID=A0A2R5G984_9STRA|nr:Protein GPR108 [Hondaea fermentalgiana]|eukprot:GBG27612.1 Protein GPR108 [Hondaea fermentalgiana]